MIEVIVDVITQNEKVLNVLNDVFEKLWENENGCY